MACPLKHPGNYISGRLRLSNLKHAEQLKTVVNVNGSNLDGFYKVEV